MTRTAVFGWGLVAPGAANVHEFAERLRSSASWLEPFEGFGPAPFLVGTPRFDFSVYESWLAARFPGNRARQLTEKMDPIALYAIGSFIQALEANPGLEDALQKLGTAAHVYVGTALASYPTIYEGSLDHYRAQRRWNRFWSQPERNEALSAHLAGTALDAGAPPAPSSDGDADDREQAEDQWFAYWAARSSELQRYLTELREIESVGVDGTSDAAKMKAIRDKRRRITELERRWHTPTPPWSSVSANVLWNVPNTPASQISMLGKITGPTIAPVAACSTFAVALKLGMDAIERGEAKLAVIGATDPPPHALTVGTFYSARVLAADGTMSRPLTQMKGTHVSGGACVWIIGDLEYGRSLGFEPIGLEPMAVGVSSDADHIITPSAEGPQAAMELALERSGVEASALVSWDLHATATPGDVQEVNNLQRVIPRETIVTARKGTFGHGMGVGGGWELTAQYLGVAEGHLFPTPLPACDLNPALAELGQAIQHDQDRAIPVGPVGKLSMGVGGINACVISQPWKK